MEVECKLENGPVYLAGEDVVASIVFSVPPTSDWEVNLAWATVQIHCFCTVNHNKVAIHGDKSVSRKSSNPSQGQSTSYQPTAGEAGVCVLSTPAKILLCDLTLMPGEKCVYSYKEQVPPGAPPSYRGAAIKYSYKVTVGTQRLDSRSVAMVKVPIRVLSVSGVTISPSLQNGAGHERLGPSSPFLDTDTHNSDTETDQASTSDLIMQAVQDITSKRRTSYYNIANTKGKVCKFCLFKTDYRIGEDIVASLDFTAGTINCVQFSVSLCMKEGVHGNYKVKWDQQDKVISHSKHHEVCVGFSHSHFVLPIPLHLAPSFSTPVCCVSYYLHFEFVTSDDAGGQQDVPAEEGGSEWQGPSRMDIETMVWDLSVRLFTTFPNHAAQGLKLETTVSGTV